MFEFISRKIANKKRQWKYRNFTKVELKERFKEVEERRKAGEDVHREWSDLQLEIMYGSHKKN